MSALIPAKVKDTSRDLCAFIVKRHSAIVQVWGIHTTPDHNTRECVDYMTTKKGRSPADVKALGDALSADFIALHNAGVIKIKFMVWRGRAWRPAANTAGPKGWGPYKYPATHFDHVHLQIADAPTFVVAKAIAALVAGPVPDPKTVTLVVKRAVQGYYGPSKPGVIKPGAKYLRKPGFKITGVIKRLKDGPYLVTKFNTWYPYEGNF